ncbi:hypothetical protein, partial [Escherichia coli]|uniref:hypothetical protein n=1 Tax=Escherichia coli TaxID=562 RepID=UPI001BDBEE97
IAWAYLSGFFIKSVTTPMYLLFILVALLLSFFASSIRNKFKGKKYFIPIKNRFSNDSEPSNYDRRTKWNYKDNDKYYFVP